MKEWIKKIKIHWLLILVIIYLVADKAWVYSINLSKEDIGIQLLKALYEFENEAQFQANRSKLKYLTTRDVYDSYTIDIEHRNMLTYLEFQGGPSSVNILESSDTYVIYSINNSALDKRRRFCLFFRLDNKGKVMEVTETECIDFYDSGS